MGLFSSSNKRTTINEDNRIINDLSGSEFYEDNSQDNSVSGELNNNTGTVNITDGGAFSLVQSANDNMAFLASDALDYGANVFSDGVLLADSVSKRGLDAALMVHEAGLAQLTNGTELALGLAQLNTEASLKAQEDNNDALTGGFQAAMQFVEDFSRSDGSELAKTNLKTVAVLALAAVAVAFFLRGK